MPKPGERHGRITAISPHTGKHGNLKVQIRCDCGTEKEIWAGNFYKTMSCGCYQRENVATTHGFRRGAAQRRPCSEYVIWALMIQRCTNGRAISYARYGGRGISVCPRWRAFENFYADMGPRPSPKHSIDRINNDGNYEPGNCRWATRLEQARNKSNNVRVIVNGRSLVKSEAAAEAGIKDSLLHARLARGWTPDEAVRVPPQARPKLNLAIGATYGHLVVVENMGRQSEMSNHVYYRVRCECGHERIVKGTHLASGRTSWCSAQCELRRQYYLETRRPREIRPCAHRGCSRPSWARGLCGTHYQAARTAGRLPPLTRRRTAGYDRRGLEAEEAAVDRLEAL